MGIFDKAKDALGDDPEQVEGGIDKAADFADDRTGAAQASRDEAGSLPDPAEAGAPPAGSPEPPD